MKSKKGIGRGQRSGRSAPVVTISLFFGGLILTQHLSFPWTMIDRFRLESTMFIFLRLGFFLALSNHQATFRVVHPA
jgi:CDP-diglyceride synthetase